MYCETLIFLLKILFVCLFERERSKEQDRARAERKGRRGLSAEQGC